MKKIVLFLSIIFLGILVFVIINRFQIGEGISVKPGTLMFPQSEQIVLKDPPFYELTIPYLQNRTYVSSIENMKEISTNNRYTTFIATYDSDSLKINGLLTQPKGEQPAQGWPAIVLVHGYIPPTEYKTQEKYVDYVDYLARNGFVVFKIDLRGHGDSQGSPTGSYYSSGYVIDTLNAVVALQSTDFVNKDRIGLWGHSMAGNIVLRSTVARSKDIKATVIWAGAGYTYKDLTTYGLNDYSYRPPTAQTEVSLQREQLFNTHGRFDEHSDFWKQVAPTNYLNDVQTTIQLHHARNDSVVDIQYSNNLNEILNTTNIPHELHTYTSGGHNLSSPSFTQAMQRTVEFYKKYLDSNK